MQRAETATVSTAATEKSQNQNSRFDDFPDDTAGGPSQPESFAAVMARVQARFSAPLSPEEKARREAERQERAKRDAAEALRNRSDALEVSGVSRRHGLVIAELKAIQSGPWFEMLQALKIAIASGKIVGIIGPRGTGKTQAAVMAIEELIGKKTCRLLTIGDLFREIRSTFSRDAEKSEMQIINKYANVGVLFLDESHERSESDFENRALTSILDKRYQGMKPTVFISNQTRAAFSESVGPSIVDRFREGGLIIECTWKSFRPQIPEAMQAVRSAEIQSVWDGARPQLIRTDAKA